MATTCTHLDQIKNVTPRTPDGCEECLKSGQQWVELRVCMTCGHVGCCDSSVGKHARQHYNATGHPVIRSYQSKHGDWMWCYIDEVYDHPPA